MSTEVHQAILSRIAGHLLLSSFATFVLSSCHPPPFPQFFVSGMLLGAKCPLERALQTNWFKRRASKEALMNLLCVGVLVVSEVWLKGSGGVIRPRTAATMSALAQTRQMIFAESAVNSERKEKKDCVYKYFPSFFRTRLLLLTRLSRDSRLDQKVAPRRF